MNPRQRGPAAIALMGPTAAGKSAVALDLAGRIPIEIVSVDSAQVYRGMDIGTAKPRAEERAAVPHHLIDIIEPTDAYSAARFVADATRLIQEIHSRGRTPLLVGGTMLYFKALREGLSALPQAVPSVRAAIEAQAAERGWPAMHAELAVADPQTAARLKPSDSQRIQRALEVYRLTGQPMSALLAVRGASPPFRLIQAALVPSDRGVLHRRIETRFDDMLRMGLVGEVAALRQRYPQLHARLPSMRCVGYRQAWQCLDGEFSVGEMRNRGVFATRQLAKRQLTWLRATLGVFTIDCLADDAARRFSSWVEREFSAA